MRGFSQDIHAFIPIFPLMNDILQDTPTFIFFAKKFLTLYVKLSTHIFQGILLPTYSIFFVICSHFIYIHVHTFERQLHATYIFAHIYIHLKTISCCTFIGKVIFVLLIHILERQFHIICSYFETHFVPFSTYMHICKAFSYLFNIHMYTVNDIFTLSRHKENMVQPKPSAGLKGKPHQHALTFMPSCI